MENKTKTIGGVSLLSILIFSIFAIQKQCRQDDWRNKEMQRKYDFQEAMKPSPQLEEFSDILDSAKCSFNSTEIPDALGTKFKIYYPCKWVESKDKIEGVLKMYYHELQNSTNSSIVTTVSVEDVHREFTNDLVNAISQVSIQKQTCENDGGYFISSTKIRVKTTPGNEVIFRKQIDSANFAFYLVNYLYTKGKLITIQYMTGATTQKEASRLFERYKPKFRQWFKKTELL